MATKKELESIINHLTIENEQLKNRLIEFEYTLDGIRPVDLLTTPEELIEQFVGFLNPYESILFLKELSYSQHIQAFINWMLYYIDFKEEVEERE